MPADDDILPAWARSVAGLRILWTQSYLPEPWRLRPALAGAIQIVTGTALALSAGALIVLGFADAF